MQKRTFLTIAAGAALAEARGQLTVGPDLSVGDPLELFPHPQLERRSAQVEAEIELTQGACVIGLELFDHLLESFSRLHHLGGGLMAIHPRLELAWSALRTEHGETESSRRTREMNPPQRQLHSARVDRHRGAHPSASRSAASR